MGWDQVKWIGAYVVYDVLPTIAVLHAGELRIGGRAWTPTLPMPKNSTGERVLVHVPVGGPSGQSKDAVVEREGTRIVELWKRMT